MRSRQGGSQSASRALLLRYGVVFWRLLARDVLDRLRIVLHLLFGGTARECPAARILHAEIDGAAPTPPAGNGPPLPGRHQQCPQSGKAVRRDEPERHQFGERLFELAAQQPDPGGELVEERRAILADAVDDRLRP